jgi:glutaredoxin
MFTSATLRFARVTALLLATAAVSAQTTYRWIDPSTGGTVISDRAPPPGARRVVKSATTVDADGPQVSYALRQASEKFPVILYTSAGCVTCKDARALLEGRGVPFSEKVLQNEEEVAELGRQLGGEALLPSVSVGRQNARGFSPSVWNALLDAATYPSSAPYRVRPASAAAE